MSVFRSHTALGNLVTFLWESTEIGDEVPNMQGISVEHPTVLAAGTVEVSIDGGPFTSYSAPVTILLPLNQPYLFRALSAGVVIFCTYNLLEPGHAAEVQHLMEPGVKLVFP